MSEVRDFVKTERLSSASWDACGHALAACYTAITVMVGSIFLCITYPPPPLWRIIACSIVSVAAFGWMVSALWRWTGAIEKLRSWNNEQLDRMEAECDDAG